MRLKFKIAILLPLVLSTVGCSKSDKITFQMEDMKFDTYYNDSYFLLDNRNLHEEIALASHAMALATFNGDEDYTQRSKYLRNLWNDEHFDNIWMSDSFYKKPETDSIAFGIASKYINIDDSDFTLIAIAVRGGNYDAEWASNFTIGNEGNAKGFDQASDMVVQGFADYLKNYEIKGHLKIWISGYSRAAITSNMTAGKILNSVSIGVYPNKDVRYTSDDIYAYCFEPPMGVQISVNDARGELYHGIHNFLNYNDPVPLVAPYEWGFCRYGVDHYYPDRLNDINFDETEREKIITLYHFTYGAQEFTDYYVDKWKFFDIGEEKAKENNLPRESVNPSQGRFCHTLVHELATRAFIDRSTYAYMLQEGIREIFATVHGYNPDIEKINTSALIDIIMEYDLVRSLIMELEDGVSGQFAMDIQMLFLQIFGANEDNFNAVKDLYNQNFALFVLLPQAFLVRKDMVQQFLYRDNLLGLICCHMPEVSYSFLCATDSRFMGDKAVKFNDGAYQTLHVKDPKTFYLMEKGLKKEIFSYADGVMKSSHVSAEKMADGSLAIYLPYNGKYEYVGDCEAVYLGENDPLGGETVIDITMPNSGEF